MGDHLGGETHGANHVGPRHQVGHLVCAALSVVVLLDHWGAVGGV